MRQGLVANALRCKFLSIDKEKVEAVVEHPGFSPNEYDVNGQPKIWNMMKLLGAVRFYAYNTPYDETGKTLRDFKQLTDDRFTFMISSELVFSKDIYDHSVPKFPLHGHVQGGYVGTSSLNTHTKIYTENESKLLCSNITQVVSVDKTTRRPKPLPDWWRQKYAEAAKSFSSLKYDKFPRQDGAGLYKCTVAWSDTDAYKHTNWSSYVRFAVDAAHHCAKKGHLPNFDENLQNGVNKAELYYCGESSEDDVIDVYAWEDQDNSKLMFFDFEKNDKSIFQCKFYFF